MGCGKSKHDVAMGYTISQSKKMNSDSVSSKGKDAESVKKTTEASETKNVAQQTEPKRGEGKESVKEKVSAVKEKPSAAKEKETEIIVAEKDKPKVVVEEKEKPGGSEQQAKSAKEADKKDVPTSEKVEPVVNLEVKKLVEETKATKENGEVEIVKVEKLIKEEARTVKDGNSAVKEETRTVKDGNSAIKEETRTVKDGNLAVKEQAEAAGSVDEAKVPAGTVKEENPTPEKETKVDAAASNARTN